jgi:hypothetical protein
MHSLTNYSKILYSDVELHIEFENIHTMQTYVWQAMGDNGLATAQLGSIRTTYNILSYFNKTEFLYIYSQKCLAKIINVSVKYTANRKNKCINFWALKKVMNHQ